MEIEALANKLAAALARELSLSEDDRDIAAYALHGIFSVSFYLSTLLISAWLLGQWKYTLIVAGTVAVLRTFMGGAHASTAWRCGLVGAAMMNGGGALARVLEAAVSWEHPGLPQAAAAASALAALAAIAAYCPADVPQKPITDPRQRRWLRWISAALVAGAWLPLTLAAAQRGWETVYFSAQAGLWIQLLLVTPVGFGWSGRVDAYLTKLLRKEE